MLRMDYLLIIAILFSLSGCGAEVKPHVKQTPKEKQPTAVKPAPVAKESAPPKSRKQETEEERLARDPFGEEPAYDPQAVREGAEKLEAVGRLLEGMLSEESASESTRAIFGALGRGFSEGASEQP